MRAQLRASSTGFLSVWVDPHNQDASLHVRIHLSAFVCGHTIDNTHLDDPSPCEVACARGVTNDAAVSIIYSLPPPPSSLFTHLGFHFCLFQVFFFFQVFRVVVLYIDRTAAERKRDFRLIINCKAPQTGEGPGPRAPAPRNTRNPLGYKELKQPEISRRSKRKVHLSL